MPTVLTNEHHDSLQEARDFLWNKTPLVWKQCISPMNINSEEKLRNSLNNTAAVLAKQNKILRMEALHNIRICSDDTVTQISVRVLSVREQPSMGGDN